MRLDLHLSKLNNISRTKAQQLVESNFVLVNGKIVNKPSFDVTELDKIEIMQDFKYASLGGDKLAKAFLDFNYSVKDKVCIDIGASNGGFTDCMLQNRAKKVYAVDVGECAFSETLKSDPKVIIKDKINARFITPSDIGEKADFMSIDVSFISLTYILENVSKLLKDDGEIIALIKPQFECGKKYLSKKGIVQSQKVIDKVIEDIKSYAKDIGLTPLKITNAPIKPEKNKEYLILLSKKAN